MLTAIERDQEIVYLYWTLTDRCNFSCSYCPETLHSGNYATGRKPGFPTDATINKFIDRLLTHHLRGRALQTCISGGEPTTHPMYAEIVERLFEHGVVETVTNGSRPLAWWQNLPCLPDKVTMSIHPEYSNIEKINQLGEYLIQQNRTVAINLMMDPAQWKKSIEYFNQLTEILQNCVQAKILSDHSGTKKDGALIRNYSQEQTEWIAQHQTIRRHGQNRWPEVQRHSYTVDDQGIRQRIDQPFQMVNARTNSFKGWRCSAGSAGLTVTYDGWAYAGNCQSERLGPIESFVLREQGIICPRQWCKAAPDIQLSKFKL